MGNRQIVARRSIQKEKEKMKILFLLSFLTLMSNTVSAQYIYYSPVITVPGIHRELINHGGEHTRQDVLIRLSNGKKIVVPIINGWEPRFTLKVYRDGSEHHLFDYRDRKAWDGRTDKIWYTSQELAARRQQSTREPLEVLPFLRRPSDVPTHPESVIDH